MIIGLGGEPMVASDDEARRQWFRREVLPLEPLLLDYARRFCRRGDEPADFVHETFARIIGYAGWREIENTRAFALRALKNCAIDAARRRSVVSISAISDLDRIDPPDPAPGPEMLLLAQDELRHLLNLVAALPPQCRKVFTLRKVYDFSHAEIAVRLGISVSTVEKHLVKGLKICSQALARGKAADALREAEPKWDKATGRHWTG